MFGTAVLQVVVPRILGAYANVRVGWRDMQQYERGSLFFGVSSEERG